MFVFLSWGIISCKNGSHLSPFVPSQSRCTSKLHSFGTRTWFNSFVVFYARWLSSQLCWNRLFWRTYHETSPRVFFNTEKWMRVLDFTRSGVLYLGSFSRYHRVYFPGTFFGCHREHSPRVFSRGSFAGQSWGASLRGRLSTCMTSCIAVYLFSIPAAFVLKMICFGFAAHTEEYVQNSYLNYWKSYHIIM